MKKIGLISIILLIFNQLVFSQNVTSPKIVIQDSSDYSLKFISELQKITKYKLYELKEDLLILDKKDTIEISYYPFIGDTLTYEIKYSDSSVVLTVTRINQTTIAYTQQFFKSGVAYVTMNGFAHLDPNIIMSGDGLVVNEDAGANMYFSMFFRDAKLDGCFTDIYIGVNRELAVFENHCISSFRYESEKKYITLKMNIKEEY